MLVRVRQALQEKNDKMHERHVGINQKHVSKNVVGAEFQLVSYLSHVQKKLHRR